MFTKLRLPFLSLLAAVILSFGLQAQAGKPQMSTFNIEQTVVKMKLEEGITAEDAIDSMKLRANNLNVMFVAHQPLSKQVAAMGVESRRLEIFQFCEPLIARQMVSYNPIFAAYMPCRIALVEEEDGTISLMMLNLDMLIQGTDLDPEMKEIAIGVNQKLMEIMTAGAEGDL